MEEDLFNPIPAFEQALSFAYRIHDGQTRKGTTIPYISHLLAVASIVLENGGDETEAIAALLHDAIEDQETPELRLRVKNQILSLFGDEVLEVVEGCSDTLAESPVADNGGKLDWKTRKIQYLEHLKHPDTSSSMLLVSSADKLHNARAILEDYREIGDKLWRRFNEKDKNEHIWYYSSLLEIFQEAGAPLRIVNELASTIEEIKRLANQKEEGKVVRLQPNLLPPSEVTNISSCIINDLSVIRDSLWKYIRLGQNVWVDFKLAKLSRDKLSANDAWTYRGHEYIKTDISNLMWSPGLGVKVKLPNKEFATHLHTDLQIDGELIHLDYLKFIGLAPLHGVEGFIVSKDNEIIGVGGHWGTPPAGGGKNWPLAIRVGSSFLSIYGPFDLDDNIFECSGVAVWERSNI